MGLLSKCSVVLATAALASCWSSSGPADPVEPPAPAARSVGVELASVTLGDDCGDGAQLPPPAMPARRAPAAPGVVAPADAPANASFAPRVARWACQQTSMQLLFTAQDVQQPTKIRIKRVELLDASGNALGDLAPRNPTSWADDHYEAWDESVAPGARVAASYFLATPAWHAMEGGEWAQRGKQFQLRVTLAVGERDKTVEKTAITPAMMEPAVPT